MNNRVYPCEACRCYIPAPWKVNNSSLGGQGVPATPPANSALSNISINQKPGGLATSTPTPASVPATPQTAAVAQPTASYTAPTTQNYGTQPTPASQPKGFFPSVVSSIAHLGTTPNAGAQGYTGQVADYGAKNAATGQQAIDIAKQFGQKYADVGQAGAKFQAGQLTTGTTPVAEGNAAVTARTTAAQQSALAAGESAALQGIGYQQVGFSNAANAANQAASQEYAGQGLQQSALGSAAGYSAPVSQFGQLTNPMTGEVISPAGGNPQLNTAVSQAIQLVQNGATPEDAMAQSGISNFGLPGQQAFTQAMQQVSNGTYNPTAASAIGQQNVTQGRTYQAIAQELSNAIQTMQPIGQKLTTFIQTTGQNPATAPLVNEQIGKVNAQLYPAQAATLNAAINDIRSYAIQILGSQSGANPTDVTQGVNSFDFSKFTAKDLASFLGDLENLGMTRLSQAQSAMQAGYGTNNGGAAPAAGITAFDQGGLNSGSMTPSSMGSNLGKALVGTIAGVASKAADVAGNAVGAAEGGVAGGAAAKLFAL